MKLVEIEGNSLKYKLFSDMDGVLSDFSKHMTKIVNEPHEEGRYDADPKYKKKMWRAVRDYQKQGGELWYELELMPDAKVLWNYIKKYNPAILSATGNEEYSAGEQKKKWLAKHLGPIKEINLVHGAADKQKFAAPNHILIDDKDKAIKPWVAAGGIGILHTSAANTIKEFLDLG